MVNPSDTTTYKRVMLKISGEALMGDKGFGLNPPTVERIAREVQTVHEMGVEICMVIGGGNIFRGLQGSAQGMERTTLRANEMSCEAIFKGTKVDGVYDSDPVKNPDAKRYDTVSFDEVLAKRLNVMDASAIALARDNNLPIIVFSLDEPGGFKGILAGEGTYTIVRD